MVSVRTLSGDVDQHDRRERGRRLGRRWRGGSSGPGGLARSRKLAWLGDQDLLAYTPGVSREHEATLKLYELDPSTGEQRVLTRQESPPQIADVAFSPSGRWLALLRWRAYANMAVQFVDLTGNAATRRVRLTSDASFADWGRAQESG